MDSEEVKFSIKIFEKGGLPYRNYTKSSLQQLFIESKTAANFELLALIEGLTYLGYFLYCNITKQPEIYEKALNDPIKGSFKSMINSLYNTGVIDDELQTLLQNYRTKRNSIIHNWLQFKTPLNPALKNYSYDEELGELFKIGLKCLSLLYKSVVPSKETWEDYVKTFSGLKKRKS